MQDALPAELPVTFVPFDFHAVCRGGRYENLAKLMAVIGDTVVAEGFFHKGAAGVASDQVWMGWVA
jgi:histidyl-tRNA synthetase